MKKKFTAAVCCLILLCAFTACGSDEISGEKLEDRMEQLYRSGLESFLQEQFDLVKYDNLLCESELHFLPAEGSNITEQQKNSTLGTKFIYVRNDIYLDRLTEEDYDMLRRAAEQCGEEMASRDAYSCSEGEKNYPAKNTEAAQEVRQMAERTFCSVISPNKIEKEEDKRILTSFDTSGLRLFANNAIVIYIATQQEFDENGEYTDEKNERDKRELLEDLCSQMESELNGVIEGTPVRVFSDICY